MASKDIKSYLPVAPKKNNRQKRSNKEGDVGFFLTVEMNVYRTAGQYTFIPEVNNKY
jgi:hypothetical protein